MKRGSSPCNVAVYSLPSSGASRYTCPPGALKIKTRLVGEIDFFRAKRFELLPSLIGVGHFDLKPGRLFVVGHRKHVFVVAKEKADNRSAVKLVKIHVGIGLRPQRLCNREHPRKTRAPDPEGREEDASSGGFRIQP